MEKREGGDIIFLFEEDETWIRVYYVYIYIYVDWKVNGMLI